MPKITKNTVLSIPGLCSKGPDDPRHFYLSHNFFRRPTFISPVVHCLGSPLDRGVGYAKPECIACLINAIEVLRNLSNDRSKGGA